MILIPGPFAPKVTQHVAGTPTHDTHGNEIPSFTDQAVTALADYPGAATETDVVTTERTLLLPPSVAASEFDEWTLPDGARYRAQGAPTRYHSPFTGTAVTQVTLRRIT